MSRGHQLGPKQLCPHCDSPMMCRTSQMISPLVRELTYQCTDVECGYCCANENRMVRDIRPSMKSKPSVPCVPMARKRRWKKKPATPETVAAPDDKPAD